MGFFIKVGWILIPEINFLSLLRNSKSFLESTQGKNHILNFFSLRYFIFLRSFLLDKMSERVITAPPIPNFLYNLMVPSKELVIP